MWVFRVLILVVLVISGVSPAMGSAGTIPLDSPLYPSLEILEVRGLVAEGHLSTRPLSDREAVRILVQARALLNSHRNSFSEEEIRQIEEALDDLDRELDREDSPLVDTYVQWSHVENEVRIFNRFGDRFEDGENLRAGTTFRRGWGNNLLLQLRPEYRGLFGGDGGESHRGVLLEGIALLTWKNLETTIGRQSLWWGPGIHGALLLSNNAEPFNLIKLSASEPVHLPGLFRHLGALKPTLFLAQLESDRNDYPRAKLLGMRLDFRTGPRFRFGLSRVIQFGGEGRKSLDAADWFKVLVAQDTTEHGYSGKDLDNNQLLSLDVAAIVPSTPPWFPFRAVKIYDEWGFEDSSGNGTPTDQANLIGFTAFDAWWIPELTWRGEYAATSHSRSVGSWYVHGVYTDGYTYRDRIIGHWMGSDSDDYYTRLQYPINKKWEIALEGSITRSNVHTAVMETYRNIALSGLRRRTPQSFEWKIRYETTENLASIPGNDQDALLLQIGVTIP